jgi:hypothetical protein
LQSQRRLRRRNPPRFELGWDRDEMRVLVEERDLVAIGHQSFAVASLTLEAMDYREPVTLV